MAITLPIGVRVAAGVLGTAFDRLGKLPENLPAIGVSLVGQAFRTSLRVRQEIAELAVRGDELLAGITGGAEEHPAWATFDEDDGGAVDPANGFRSTGGLKSDWTGDSRPDTGDPGDHHYGDFGHEVADLEVVLLEAAAPTVIDPLGAAPVTIADLPEPAAPAVADPPEPAPPAVAAPRRSTATSAAATSDEPTAAPEHRAAAAKRAAANARTAAAVRRAAAARAAAAGGEQSAAHTDRTSAGGRRRARAQDPDKAAILDHPGVGAGTEPSGLTSPTSSGVSLVEGVQDFSVAELKVRLQGLDVASVRELLQQEEAGPQRAAYLTLLTNRLTTLEHENG